MNLHPIPDYISIPLFTAWMWGPPMFNFFKNMFGPMESDLEFWARRNANKATSDDIIEAAVIQSFAKDFDKWNVFQMHGVAIKVDSRLEDERTPEFISGRRLEKDDICIVFQKRVTSRDRDGLSPWKDIAPLCLVNDIPIAFENSQRIWAAWEKMVAKVKAAEEAAAKAKTDMERNEMAWNLAEKLLGMKRNEQGALVPQEQK